MRNRNFHSVALSLCLVLAWHATPAVGQVVDGSDGPLDCTALGCVGCDAANPCTVVIDLCGAIPGDALLTPGTGNGVYDAARWAVVFHYTTVNIPAGVTVTFKNHPKGAPVVWFATGDVTITGKVELNGANGSNSLLFPYAIPGPGGFSGGISNLGGSAGFGPGGGERGNDAGGGSYGTLGISNQGLTGVTYGTASILPLIGGSGGGADSSFGAGGAGGGAILIASSGNIFLPDMTGGIFANGGVGTFSGAGGGSGGSIRLIANGIISGPGMLHALGGTTSVIAGGHGRIRLEVPDPLSDIQLVSTPMPQETRSTPGLIFPAATAQTQPTLRVTAVNGKSVTADPSANVLTPEVAIGANFPVNIDIELLNMDQAAGMLVDVRVVQGTGGISQTVQSMPLADDGTMTGRLTATAVFDFSSSPGNWEVQLSLPLP